MKKRIISIALLVVIVLMVGIIIGWLVSPAGQFWSRSWLGRPDGLTAVATVEKALFMRGDERRSMATQKKKACCLVLPITVN